MVRTRDAREAGHFGVADGWWCGRQNESAERQRAMAMARPPVDIEGLEDVDPARLDKRKGHWTACRCGCNVDHGRGHFATWQGGAIDACEGVQTPLILMSAN